jgi:hypothetical protein
MPGAAQPMGVKETRVGLLGVRIGALGTGKQGKAHSNAGEGW